MSEKIRCINYSFAVPESSEKLRWFSKHAAWMEEFYSVKRWKKHFNHILRKHQNLWTRRIIQKVKPGM